MPTLPFPPDESHRHRLAAESFGSDAERYDRARPRYPDALVEAVVVSSPGPEVLDVGIGTGISARPFRAAGGTVLGVDPDPRMAAYARRDGFDVEVAAFEAWDPAGRTFDAVVAGQTWHWIDPVAGAGKAAAVLRPGGRLAVFWNAFRPSPGVAEALAAAHRRVLPESPLNPWTAPALDGYAALYKQAADGIRRSGAFDQPEQWSFDWERPYTRDEWLDQLRTGGDAARIPPARMAELLEGTGDAVDALGGRFTMRFTAVVVTAVRGGAG
ncbi:class I SAM-dependent methyltransferase [Kitasatospora hibisci]|uniref:class I SAM-dependent methyltransferase n=1 Tax=Kitasatospora hibisci TaxID=3369522 RepID=UPI0037551DEE